MSIRPQQMEMFVASEFSERLGGSDRLMERILERGNIIRAWERVLANKGAPWDRRYENRTTQKVFGETLAEDRAKPVERNPQTDAGEAERDPQTGWGRAFTWNPYGA